MPDTNIFMVQKVADGLGELTNEVVFIGGSVAELYATDPAASEIRPTLDVDCVMELGSRLQHARLEENLRAKGFVNDKSQGAPICRWIYRDIVVDVMPSDAAILGFSNRWYEEGIYNRIRKVLPGGMEIFIFPSEYYLATKFEAYKGRGGEDLRQSHDFEDIIYIMDNCLNLLENIRGANEGVKLYLKAECQSLLENRGLGEGISCALPHGSGDERPKIIEDLIRNIAEI